jgi:zinc transport system ATP-binding protein
MLKAAEKATPPELVRLENVGIKRAGRWLVRGVGLSVHAGEIVTIIGPNGSGKSTTAKTVIGVMAPDEGQVISTPELQIGYVPQSLTINPSMPLSVERLLSLSAGRHGDDLQAVLEMVGAADLRHDQIHGLSGGEFQRVLLARAMLGRPDLLVLDEPVAGVDFTGSIELYRLISKIRDDSGCGVLLISHDLHVVMAQTDVVVCLNQHVCCTGTPELVTEDPEYIKLFGEAGELAFYKHRHDHSHLADGRVVHEDGRVCDNHHDCGDHGAAATGATGATAITGAGGVAGKSAGGEDNA